MSFDAANFSPGSALLGGALIGVSATLLLLLHGRVAGITGIVGGAIDPETRPEERVWRLLFVAGLVVSAGILLLVMPERFELGIERAPWLVVLAGVLVGVGTRLGSGCTSGHGVCGVSRGSGRSIAATLTFMATGFLTVMAYRALSGGV
jgi:uncharacterized membrane protein YedE/YeeE